ncbi:MAG: hypothetical protein ACREQ7_18535 [Candidatus Binatia bacterium]
MNPSIWIYGGFHYDPGTRQRFLKELAKQQTAPHFVAVEWEKSVFEKFVQWRPWVEERLGSCWDFLTPEDCHELSLALAWEGDAYAERFPGADPLWLEIGFQEANFKQRYGVDDLNNVPESFAYGLLQRLCNPGQPTMNEWIANVDPPPAPRTKKDLVDRVWRKVWSEADGESGGFDRDGRWARAICERSSGLHEGWIAVVVGWKHADSTGGNQRLRGLLLSKGFSVNSVRLGP